MHRSSSAIGAIAGALSKAQTELVNPEKSLTATIRSPLEPSGMRSFRYAPLSTGLDIVRKCLGKHEIALIQTTSLDQDAGIVRLVSVLAHSSGEWISSDWPVCPISEIVSPQRMGAALTYARRYALFSLVGIAGEDDLDCPELSSPSLHGVGQTENPTGRTNGKAQTEKPQANPYPRRPNSSPGAALLAPERSAAVRDELLAEVEKLSAADELIDWAGARMKAKNGLAENDARMIERAFEERMKAVCGDISVPLDSSMTPGGEPPVPEFGATAGIHNAEPADRKPSRRKRHISRGNGPDTVTQRPEGLSQSSHHDVATSVDKSALTIATPKRHRNKHHLRFVASHACLVCGRQPSDPHHLRFGQMRGLGMKVSDEFTVPLCRIHHRQAHHSDDERKWWSGMSIDPLQVANTLWQQTVATSRDSAVAQSTFASPRSVPLL